jgi:putative membrane protein
MMDGCMMGGGMMMGGMMLGMLLFWTLVIVGIVLLVRFIWDRTAGGHSDALSILQERFARGEINREEYEERRNILQRRR